MIFDLHPNTLMLFGTILLAGVMSGQLAHNTGIFPRITGYILIGFILGPNISGILNDSLLESVKVFADLSIGLVLFQLGLQVDLKHLLQQKILLLTGIFESTLTLILLFSTLVLLKVDYLHAALVAAIGISSSPAVTLLIANEFDVKGPVTETSLILTAINNVLAFCFFTIISPFLRMKFTQGGDSLSPLLIPFYRLFGAIIFAYCLSIFMLWVGRFIGKRENIQFSLLAGTIIFAIGAANFLQVSPLMTMLVLGMIIATLDKENYLMEVEFGHSGEIFFVVLFVIAGANLHIHNLIEAGWVALLFVVVRMLSKLLPMMIMSKKLNLNRTQAYSLGLTLLPMASMAIGLVNTIRGISVEFASTLTAIILAAVAILETIGPIVTVMALKKANELTEYRGHH